MLLLVVRSPASREAGGRTLVGTRSTTCALASDGRRSSLALPRERDHSPAAAPGRERLTGQRALSRLRLRDRGYSCSDVPVGVDGGSELRGGSRARLGAEHAFWPAGSEEDNLVRWRSSKPNS